MAITKIDDFRIGIQLSDNAARQDFGKWQFTNWMSERPRWSDWAGDGNYYDPDAIRLNLEPKRGLKIDTADFRLIIQAGDGGGLTGFGIPRYTPWATQIGADAESGSNEEIFSGGHWSGYAFDSNYYDPDVFRIGLVWRRWPGMFKTFELIDLRIGIQLIDDKGRERPGEPYYTPWLSDGGGLSGWAVDPNGFDFDGARIGLDVRLGKVPQ